MMSQMWIFTYLIVSSLLNTLYSHSSESSFFDSSILKNNTLTSETEKLEDEFLNKLNESRHHLNSTQIIISNNTDIIGKDKEMNRIPKKPSDDNEDEGSKDDDDDFNLDEDDDKDDYYENRRPINIFFVENSRNQEKIDDDEDDKDNNNDSDDSLFD